MFSFANGMGELFSSFIFPFPLLEEDYLQREGWMDGWMDGGRSFIHSVHAGDRIGSW